MVVVAAGTACGADGGSDASGQCPGAKVAVVVTVDQWSDIVGDLVGDCGTVTTIVKGSTSDPDDYVPTPADTAKFSGAALVVVNGLGYDSWADDAIAALATKPLVLNGGDVLGLNDGDNPHIWYGPDYVDKVADEVTAALKQLAGTSAGYFDQQHQAWEVAMKPYDAEIAALAPKLAGKNYAATEPVFDYMAAKLGLKNLTPPAYHFAVSEESEPATADVAKFHNELTSGHLNLLVHNSQTDSSTAHKISEVATKAKVPVLEVTETPPSSSKGFVDWQLGQLRQLGKALG